MQAWRTFSRLISGSRHLAAWSLCLSLVQSAALIPIALLVKGAFDDAIPDGDTGALVLTGAAIVGLYLLSLLFGLVGRYIVLRVTKPAVAGVRAELLERVLWLPASFYDDTDGGRLHSLIVQDTERLDLMAKSLLAIVIPSLGTAALLLAALAAIEPRLLALLLVTIGFALLLNTTLRRAVRPRIRAWQEESDAFSAGVLGALRTSTLVKVQAAEEREITRGAAQADVLGAAGLRMSWMQHAYSLAQIALGGVAGVLVLVAGGIGVAEGTLSLGDLIAFMAVLALARGQLNWVIAAMPDVLTGFEAIDRVDSVLARTEREPYRGGRPIELRGAPAWEGVTFGYAEGERPVLEDVSLAVEPGEMVAILGPTGAGKSTLVALLLGLYRPWAGRICVDGAPLDEIDVRSLRRQVGVLLQDQTVVRGSVRDNIAFGRDAVDDADLERAAALSMADQFVAELHDGYDTEIGDDGVRLSAGQRQRVALARALVDFPRLLALDEPTSHLDEATAGALLDNLTSLESRPTLLVVTHDPVVAARADRTVVVRGGQVTRAEDTAAVRAEAR